MLLFKLIVALSLVVGGHPSPAAQATFSVDMESDENSLGDREDGNPVFESFERCMSFATSRSNQQRIGLVARELMATDKKIDGVQYSQRCEEQHPPA